MEPKQVYFTGHFDDEEVSYWHEYRSSVSVSEARSLYRGCYIRNGEDYLEIHPRHSSMRAVGDNEYRSTNLSIFVPTIMPQREGAGHYLPFECALRKDVHPLFGTTMSAIFTPGIDSNVYPCKVRMWDDSVEIKINADIQGSEYILLYAKGQKLEAVSSRYKLISFKIEFGDEEISCLLLPTSVIHRITPFTSAEVMEVMHNSQRITEELEFSLAHAH